MNLNFRGYKIKDRIGEERAVCCLAYNKYAVLPPCGRHGSAKMNRSRRLKTGNYSAAPHSHNGQGKCPGLS